MPFHGKEEDTTSSTDPIEANDVGKKSQLTHEGTKKSNEDVEGRHWFANYDIHSNILSRLPAKMLHYLKLVEKEWYNLISERSFISSQIKKTEPLSRFFFQEIFQDMDEDSPSISYIPVDVENVKLWGTVLNFLPENVVILSLTNGLLCCRSCLPTSDPVIYICNPLNKHWRRLDWPKLLPRRSSVAVAFDHFRDPLYVSTDFKLVVVTEILNGDADEDEDEENEFTFLFDIYSSKTGLWRRSKESFQCDHDISKNKGAFVEGNLYWLTDGFQILMFNPETEFSMLVMTPLPATTIDAIPKMCIGESYGKLCYVIISEDGLQLWALEDNITSEWGFIICVSLNELAREHQRPLRHIAKLLSAHSCVRVDDGIDLLAFKDGKLVMRVYYPLYLYEFDMGRMQRLCSCSNLEPESIFSIVVPYTMSLVPLA